MSLKRRLAIVGIILGLVVVSIATLIGSAFIGRQSIADGTEVGDVRVVKDGIVSVGVVPVGGNRIALVDAGNDKSGKAILAELGRRNLSAPDVVAIFITHGHADHVAAAPLFRNARVMALARETPMVQGLEGSHGPVTRLFPVSPTGIRVSRLLLDGDTVTAGDTPVRVYAVPGHTAGSAAYLVKGVLFMGDAADAASDGHVIVSPWVFSDSQAQERASLARLAERLQREHAEVKAIAFAHSGVRTEGLAPLAAFAAANRP